MTVSKNLARILMVCAIVFAGMGASTTMAVEPSTIAVTPGQERDWLLEKYVATARFELRAGKVVVWEPASNDVRGSLVEFGGVLDDEAARVLGELLGKGRIGTLSLTSPGGMVVPTLKLGRAIKAKRVTTVVEAGRGCYSACALLFLAGENRILGGEPKSSIRSNAAEVGFHAPYILGADGVAKHLQDVKTSSSCAYIKELISQSVSAELCEYMLATKGMATFSFEEGKRLQIYTDSASDIVQRWSDTVMAAAAAEEKQWVTCERFRLHLQNWQLARTSESELERNFPCSGGLKPQTPSPQSRQIELSKVVRALGPNNIPKDVMSAAYQMLADRTVLTAYDQHYISCQRSFRWLNDQGKVPPLNQMLNAEARSAEFEVWRKACTSLRKHPEGRNIEGFGYLTQNMTMFMLNEVARKQGVNWPPPEPFQK